jgi:hypothetical protein
MKEPASVSDRSDRRKAQQATPGRRRCRTTAAGKTIALYSTEFLDTEETAKVAGGLPVAGGRQSKTIDIATDTTDVDKAF